EGGGGRVRRRLQVTVHPAVLGRLPAGGAALHEVLGVEVRASRVGAAHRVDDGQALLLPEREQRLEGRMQAEEAVEVEGGVLAPAPRSGDRDAGPERVRVLLAVGADRIQSVTGPALETH